MSAEHGLTPTERALLFMACRDHPVARCPACDRRYTRTEVGADLLGSDAHLCPTCRVDLTASIREHLLSCSAAAVLEAQELRPVELRQDAQEARKAGEQPQNGADLLSREIEERRQRGEG